jgi:hypothetical protein
MLDRRAAAADRFLAARWRFGAPLTQPRASNIFMYLFSLAVVQ